jgi:hypothetical protein
MRELMAFREHVFRHVQEDWRDVVARAGSLWSPRRRYSQSATAAAAGGGGGGEGAAGGADMDTEGINTATGKGSANSAAAIISIPASSCKVVPPVVAVTSDIADDESSGGVANAATATSAKGSTADAASSTCDCITAAEEIRPAVAVAAAAATGNNASDTSEVHNVSSKTQEVEAEEMVVVEESAIPEFWIPGRIVHIYAYRGQYRAVEVPRDFPTLRKIELQGNSFNDHNGTKIFDALLEVRRMTVV